MRSELGKQRRPRKKQNQEVAPVGTFSLSVLGTWGRQGGAYISDPRDEGAGSPSVSNVVKSRDLGRK